MVSRKRLTRAAGAAALALLALPPLAGARPGAAAALVQRSGRLVILHADRLDGSSTHEWTLVNGTSHLPVRAPAGVWADPGTPVRLEGTMRNGTLVLSDSATAVGQLGLSPLEAGARDLAAAPAMHTTAVILAGFAGGPAWTSPANPDNPTATSLMFNDPSVTPGSLNAYYLDATYGQIGFQGTVFGPVTIPGASTDCGSTSPNYAAEQDALYTWLDDAEQAAGVSDSAYQHIVVALPAGVSCAEVNGASGIAELGGHHVWINGAFKVPVIAHELGHNLGLAHAGGLKCSAATVALPLGNGACTTSGYEYEDPFDPMGQSYPGTGGSLVVRQLSMEHKLALNLLPASAVQVVGASGTYQLAPMETLVAGATELLRIPKLGGGSWYVEYRRPIGYFDSQVPAFQGVYVRTASPDIVNGHIPPNGSDTALVDMHPATAFGSAAWGDARMAAGETFSDPAHHITIQSGVQDASGATLQVTLPVDMQAPSAPGSLSAVATGTTVALTWTPASDDVGVAAYQVTRDGVLAGSPITPGFADTGLAPGTTVTYGVTAVDASGNAGPAASVSVLVPDTQAPTTPANVVAVAAKDGRVHLAWDAAGDDSGVAGYRVLRDGTALATVSVTTYVDGAPKPGTAATIAYAVVAFDRFGNESRPGSAAPVRAALLRTLGATHVRAVRVKGGGGRKRVRVSGIVSDAKARCRLRVGARSAHDCKARANGAFSVTLAGGGSAPVTLLLSDALGRVRLQTLRVR